jgi:4-hydroxy-tetrahydrodipicolinate synthase
VNGVDADTLRLLAGAPPDFAVLCGDDAFILPLLLMGAGGAIAASAHLCTERFAALVAAAGAGRVDEAREHAEALLALVLALFSEPSPAVLKAMLHDAGRIATPALRMPLQAASEAGLARARRSAPSRSSARAPARAR